VSFQGELSLTRPLPSFFPVNSSYSDTEDADNLSRTININVYQQSVPLTTRTSLFTPHADTSSSMPAVSNPSANVPTFPCPRRAIAAAIRLAFSQVPKYPNPHLLLMYSRRCTPRPLSRGTRYAYYSVDHLHARDSPGLPTTPTQRKALRLAIFRPR
jgi:hypothetical protein